MTRLWGFLANLGKDQKGATMVEYSILIAIITALVIGLILGVGHFVSGAWADLCNALASTTPGCTPG
ncbi:MAG TPA: Flp family type IVb pilin [Dongiaceae bacterium]